jgi:hypothetical protein
VQNNSSLPISPRSPTPWPAEAFAPWPTLLTALAAVAIALGGALLFTAAAAALLGRPERGGKLPIALSLGAQVTGYLCAYVYLMRALPALAHRSKAELGVRPPRGRDILAGLTGAIGMIFAVSLTSDLVLTITHKVETEPAMQLLAMVRTHVELALFIATVAVVAPLVEELFFRVFIYNAIERYAGAAGAVVVSALLFGLVHGPLSPSIALPLAAGGAVLAVVYASTRCYYASVITHATFNLTVLAFAIPKLGGSAS